MKITTLIISVFAILFSAGSLYFACVANLISKKAAYQASRPRIQFSPAKYPNGRHYSFEERNGKINFEIQLLLHNTGNSTAINIKYTKEKITLKIIGGEFSHSPDLLITSPSIGPKQKLLRIFPLILDYKSNKEEHDKLIMALKNDDLNLILETMIEYFDSTSENKHTTYALYEIEKSNVKVIKYEEK